MSDKIVLIDGHSILNRAFYGLPDLTNAEGLHTNAIYGFLNIMFKIIEEEQASYLCVAFDLPAPTFRHKMYDAYKGTRKPAPSEFRQQVPIIKDVLRAMEIPVLEQEGYEADDILGTIANRCEAEGMEVTIVSGDRDLLQLATDHTRIRIPKTKGGKTTIEDYNTKDVIEHYQLEPWQIVELKALMGDSSDNIPGIPGVGEKTATKILLEYNNIENAYEHVEEIKPNKAKESLQNNYELAKLSKVLATINTQVPMEFDVTKAEIHDLYTQEAYEWFRELEFKNLLNRFESVDSKNTVEEYFQVIDDFQAADEVFVKLSTFKRVGVWPVMEQELWGLGLCGQEEQIYYIPVGGFLTEAYLCDRLEQLIASVDEVTVMDVKALLKRLENPEREHLKDVGIGAYLLNPLKSGYTYDDLAKEYLGIMIPSKEDLLGKVKMAKALEEIPEKITTMACYGAYVMWSVYPKIMDMLKEQDMQTLFDTVEMPLLFTLHDMEKAGIRVDAAQLKEYGEKLTIRIDELEKIIYDMAGETFNINSPKQLGVILFEKLQLPGGKKTKTGYSTAADILEKLAAKNPIVNYILEYRQLTKLKSTYADGLANYISTDGRIHSTFNQTITATGRISSTEPNLQNIPIRMELGRLIRKVFIPKEGYIFLDADYSQIELRVLAHMSGDEKLIQAYNEAQDIHRLTASEVFHTPFDEVTPLQRRNAKAVNFGIVYGISSFGLSQDLSITPKEAGEYIKQYFETYPKIKGFLDGLVQKAKETGYIDTMFHRRRPVPELKSSNFMQRSFGERVAMNSPIQGTAADIIKIAMIRVHKRLMDGGFKSRLLLQIHDELLVETHPDEIAQVSEIIREEMQNAANLEVKLEIDMHQGDNWYEAK